MIPIVNLQGTCQVEQGSQLPLYSPTARIIQEMLNSIDPFDCTLHDLSSKLHVPLDERSWSLVRQSGRKS